jgi:uncharacterized protein
VSVKAEITVKIAPEGGQATLRAPPGLEAAMVAPQTLTLLAREAGVLIDREVERNIAAFAAAYGREAGETTAIIARSTPPVNGADGQVEWQGGRDPNDSLEHAPPPSADQTDHYAGQCYLWVKAGDVVGVARQPTNGTDGRDVRGGVIKARAGQPVPVRIHSTLSLDSVGRIVAQADGILAIRHGELSVSPALEVPGYVDFSTGHIDFAGSVAIAKGVRSGFKVNAGGDLRVGGLIESAEIRCSGDLTSRGGMAGNGRGSLSVGRNAHILYLEKVTGATGGDLIVVREIIDCVLKVGGDLRCPNGTILGGEVAVSGSLVVKVLGSDAYTPTTILLGEVPRLIASRKGVGKTIEQLKQETQQMAEQERLIRLNPRPSPKDRERLTEIAYEMSVHAQELSAQTAKLEELDAAIRTQRKLDVHVSKGIHPHVTLRIGDSTVQFRDFVKGPLWILWDEQRRLLFRTGAGDPRPLGDVAHVVRGGAADAGQRSVAA